MIVDSKMITCKNGKSYEIKGIGPINTEQFVDFMRQVSFDTHFMSRYGDEIAATNAEIEAERSRLKGLAEDSRQGMISIFENDRIIGNIAIRSVGKGRKTAHRCSIGLGIRKEYHGLGLGTILMDEAISFAKRCGYSTIELGVLSDNTPARKLYEKMGFKEWGRLPDAFHLDDGTSIDEITMYKAI